MLNNRFKTLLTTTTTILSPRLSFWLSHYSVKEVRGDYLYVLEDREKELQYMREIETEDGRRGIVLKIEELSATYVAMYQIIPKSQQNEFNLKQKNIAWQASAQRLKQPILDNKDKHVFNVNGKSISAIASQAENTKPASSSRTLLSLTPLIDVCYDLQYGEMFNFSGCFGSRKTTTLTRILKQFNSKQKHTGLYFNPTSFSEATKVIQESNSWAFNNGQVKRQEQTDVGIYMLALKTIHLAKLLSKEGWNVLLALDNFKNVLQAEWHMLQLLNNTNNKRPGEFISYSAPKISPISLINEVYASCNDFSRSRGKVGEGSLTAILLTESQAKGDDLMPQITPYTNNLKHLASLTQKIEFPVTIRHNFKTRLVPIDPFQPQPLKNYIQTLRKHINDYLREKQESELKRKLYKSDMHDAPWDYYNLLDAEWWLQGLQTCKISNELEEAQFLRWIVINIQHQLIPHWKIKCNEAFALYTAFLTRQSATPSLQTLESFIGWAKLEGVFSPFKKDYLS